MVHLSLADRTYIVTGGGSGIGKGVAAAIVESGGNAMLVGRNAERLATVTDELNAGRRPVAAAADVCAEHGMWLHVDAAYGGSAAVAPALRHVLDGCERADSLLVNPHKWLLTPMDCSVLYTARPTTCGRPSRSSRSICAPTTRMRST